MLRCQRCEKATDKDRLPRGWKRHAERIWCERCWRDAYVLRAIAVPVVRPLHRPWSELRDALNAAWADSTACANWAITQLYARDIRRNGEAKLPGMAKCYLYPEARERFPGIASNSIVSLLQAVDRKYREARYEVVWTSGASLPNFRYPMPAPYHNATWKASYEPAGESEQSDKVPCVTVQVRNGDKFTLQLRGGKDFARQLASFRQIVSGEACQGELAIYRQRVGGSEHRSGMSGRDSGGQKAHFRVMLKMVAWFPRQAVHGLQGVLAARSDIDAMVCALDEKGERLWWLNADHVRRWQAEHKRRLHRWSEDAKHENRPVANFQSLRERVCQKMKNRLASFCREAASQLVNFAKRRKYAGIRWDDSERGYCPEFVWFQLKDRIALKCHAEGLTFEHASAEVPETSGAALADTETQEDEDHA